ncbi:MAG: ATP synthase F1 subunit gamma [Armatimonadota bacterium]
MASVKDLRRRIKVVKNIAKITNAMKMVASARLRKAQEQAEAARPYAEKIYEVMLNLADSAGSIEHPLLEVRPEKKIAYVIIGAERGLAGSYNANVMNRALYTIKKHDKNDDEHVRLFLVGRKAIAFYRKLPYDIEDTLELSGNGVSFMDIKALTTKIRTMFETGELDAVYLVYSKFISPMKQEPTVVRVLPMVAPEKPIEAGTSDMIFEPNSEELLTKLLPKYVDTEFYQAFVEAQASEQGARMTAMSSATKNAEEMIVNLTLEYNKARQSAITSEILEIVAGAEALK